MKSTVVFDFDGTLADSMQLFIEAVNKSAAKLHHGTIDPGDVSMLRGRHPRQVLRHLRISLLKLPLVMRSVRKEVGRGVARARPAADMSGALGRLKKGGCSIGILTSNTEKSVREFLAGNGMDVFDFVYSGRSAFGKGRTLRAIAKRAGGRVFYVGDEVRDIEAARRAGTTMIAVAWGFNTAEALMREGPDYLATTPDQIDKIVLGG